MTEILLTTGFYDGYEEEIHEALTYDLSVPEN